MANRCTLHINKLNDFKEFLITKGYMEVEVKGGRFTYEVLRMVKGKDTLIVYKKLNAKEHVSVMNKDIKLLSEFLKRK